LSRVGAADRAQGLRPRHHGDVDERARTGRFRPKGWLDRVFEVGIVLKGLDGLAELVGAALLLLVGPAGLHHWVVVLTQGELSEDPDDVVAHLLLRTSSGLDGHAVLFGAAYLLVHGLVKVVLVIALLRNRLWAYPWMVGVLLAFIAYQLYRIALSPGVGLVALTAFDALVVALTWREWRVQRAARRASADDAGRTAAERQTTAV
jgi:uncharacterized membrane protein